MSKLDHDQELQLQEKTAEEGKSKMGKGLYQTRTVLKREAPESLYFLNPGRRDMHVRTEPVNF